MKRRTASRTSLSGLYHRVDAVRMNPAERVSAKAALAQADALANALLALADLAKRALGLCGLHHHSAH
jgi:hypothetical protein